MNMVTLALPGAAIGKEDRCQIEFLPSYISVNSMSLFSLAKPLSRILTSSSADRDVFPQLRIIIIIAEWQISKVRNGSRRRLLEMLTVD